MSTSVMTPKSIVDSNKAVPLTQALVVTVMSQPAATGLKAKIELKKILVLEPTLMKIIA